MSTPPFQVVDLFAGPGGLGEGFSAFATPERSHPFGIALSIEKDPIAAMTLRWRAFTRGMYARGTEPARLIQALLKLPDATAPSPEAAARLDLGAEWQASASEAARDAVTEAWNHELGEAGRGLVLERLARIDRNRPVVLIGGPPCQAYSLVGRARNKGKDDYVAREDHRHFLYREYLHVLRNLEPDAFVMENVKGILSAKVDDLDIFSSILADLQDPARAVDGAQGGARYRIHALPTGRELERPGDAVVRMEHWGIPQKRHRVILLGVRTDVGDRIGAAMTPLEAGRLFGREHSVLQALAGLPQLRSGLSREADALTTWQGAVSSVATAPWLASLTSDIQAAIRLAAANPAAAGRGGDILAVDLTERPCHDEWYAAHQTGYVLNHATRGHMRSDLARYLFASAFAASFGRSPALRDFPRDLLPEHENVKGADDPIFGDRFKVQVWNTPSSTVTSHISKDGHYFIHPDPRQCRSLTVREAARLQTFPDDYFFCGPRTEQYRQVGNAVPPLLASLIAEIVHATVTGAARGAGVTPARQGKLFTSVRGEHATSP